MTPRTKEQNEQIRIRRMAQILKAAADVYLDKGMLMEIRDVAAEAGLGYGTVYHYYKNKADLLNDLLSQAIERAGKILGVSSVGAAAAAGGSGSIGRIRPIAAMPAGPKSCRELAGMLLASWADDHALYLACQLGADHFRTLPQAEAEQLSAAYREQVLLPLASLMSPADAATNGADSGHSPPDDPGPGRQAEWLLAALAGCALPSIRRGTLHKEAEQIIRFLF
ncbi:helix-turn-helix domain-containing protein [Paenibacillus vini]|uniref:HTH tetR-type domain-containing protein n=1 Tax=Paenibacillus vini TaxID=1476024 RepID=A0ABQ4M8E7_9BACL|nr:TetR/AcrR family transcriptional regulator [Paenibacillus vini]GIP51927.1 hypothetical protein J42TS3_09620 [Paenibacillus vini]